ncbi:orotidine-5'-phosphate decarboxylase [bacterium]|nr:MAG: orotidine-5'-phosphate decarboxylase [bacterium]
MSISFCDRLREAVSTAGCPICVGLDPDPKLLPEHFGPSPEGCLRFLTEIIAATCDLVPAYKPNSAFFEAYGSAGWSMLEKLRDLIGPQALLILDAKRGDVEHTNAAYANAVFQHLKADAITVHPYLGGGALNPFMQDPAKGMFVLCVTSNPGAVSIQNLMLESHPLYIEVARQAKHWSAYDNVGLVVGTTKPDALKSVLKVAPELPYLLPGSGAQGGTLKVTKDLKEAGSPYLLNFARSILYASDGKDFAEAAREEVLRLRKELANSAD